MNIDGTHINGYLAAWSAIGPLAGIIVGHLLLRSWQQKQWRLDNRKEEFRELVSAISGAAIEFVFYKEMIGSVAEQSFDSWLTAQRQATKTIADRVYIAADIEALNVGDRFLEYSHGLRERPGLNEDLNKMDGLIKEIVALARKG